MELDKGKEDKIFDGVRYLIVGSYSRGLNTNLRCLEDILAKLGAVKVFDSRKATHIITETEDFQLALRKFDCCTFASLVTPKWVSVSDKLNYRMPIVCHSTQIVVIILLCLNRSISVPTHSTSFLDSSSIFTISHHPYNRSTQS